MAPMGHSEVRIYVDCMLHMPLAEVKLAHVARGDFLPR
jgi:hypothetical protein